MKQITLIQHNVDLDVCDVLLDGVLIGMFGTLGGSYYARPALAVGYGRSFSEHFETRDEAVAALVSERKM